MCVRYFVWNFIQKVFPIHWKMHLFHNVDILRALKSKSCKAFSTGPHLNIRTIFPVMPIKKIRQSWVREIWCYVWILKEFWSCNIARTQYHQLGLSYANFRLADEFVPIVAAVVVADRGSNGGSMRIVLTFFKDKTMTINPVMMPVVIPVSAACFSEEFGALCIIWRRLALV